MRSLTMNACSINHCEDSDIKLDSGIYIYVVCLSSVSQGQHYGVWIDVLEGEEHIEGEIKKLLSESPAADKKEWEIHDYKGFGELKLHEHECISQVIAYAEFIQEHGEDLGSAVLTYVWDVDEAIDMMQNRYHGQHRSEAAFVEELFHDIGEIPSYLENYIDYEAMARDLFIDDYLSIEVGGDVHVFSNC